MIATVRIFIRGDRIGESDSHIGDRASSTSFFSLKSYSPSKVEEIGLSMYVLKKERIIWSAKLYTNFSEMTVSGPLKYSAL